MKNILAVNPIVLSITFCITLLTVDTGLAQSLFVNQPGSDNVTEYTMQGTQIGFFHEVGSAGMAMDAEGNLYVTSSFTDGPIDKIDPLGHVSFFAATAGGEPEELTIDGAGNLYSANLAAHEIFKVTPQGVVSTIATGSTSGPYGIAYDPADGDIYFSDYGHGSIVELTPSGSMSTFATGFYSNAITFDSRGNLFAVNFSGNDIIEITPTGSQSVFASNLSEPHDVAFDSQGNLYCTDDSGVIKITPGGAESIFIAGGEPNYLVFGPSIVPEPTATIQTSLGGVFILVASWRRGWHSPR